VCPSCKGVCCQTQASQTVDDPPPADDNRSRMSSRESGAVESFGHTAVVPAGRPVVGTFLQARMLKRSTLTDPSLLLNLGGTNFLTPCVMPPFRWAPCRAAGGVGRVDLVNPATGVPWATTALHS